MSKVADFFKFKEHNTNLKTEIIAGLTTFMTMAYVLVVQPGAIVGYGGAGYITDVNGVVISSEAIVVTCAVVSALITLFMAFYTNLPFALSTGMGSNFMFGTLIQNQQLSFGGAMAMILISGSIFVILTVFGIRDLIVRAIPKNIKISIGTAIGFYIAYLGFQNTGITTFTESGMSMGALTDPDILLAVLGLVIIAVLTAYKVTGAMLIGIIIITILGIPAGVTTLPETVAALPDFAGLRNVVFNLDFGAVVGFSSVILIFTAFCGDFFSTLGTVMGVGAKAGMLDENGDFPNIQKPFLVDAIGTVVGALTGNTVITTYIESSAGVEAGGRTGFTGVVTAIMFLIMVFFSPLVLMIPDAATGPALIFVGFLMITGFKNIDFSDFTDSFGPFVMIMFTIFTASIASGIASGILAYVLIKTLTGKFADVHPLMYVLSVPLVCYFIFA